MNKEKKPTTKPKQKELMSFKELIELELEIPDVMMGSFDNDTDFEKYLAMLDKHVNKLLLKHGEHMEKSERILEQLTIYIDKYGELFAEEYGEINRDMIKWSLVENMKKSRAFIDKIQELEKKLGLSMHHKW